MAVFNLIYFSFKNDVKDRKDAAVIYLDAFKTAKTMFPDKDSLGNSILKFKVFH